MPGSAVQTFTDPHEYQSSIRATDVTVLLTGRSRGQFHAKLTRMDLHKLWMRSGETSAPYLMRGGWTNDRCIIHFLAGEEQTPYHHNGMELSSGSILVNAVGTEFYRRSTGRRSGSMSLTIEDLASASRALIGRELTAPTSTKMVKPPAQMMSQLLRLYDTAENLAATAPEILTHPEVARAIEQKLVQAMVACIADGASVRDDDTRGHRVPVMQRLERVLEENRGNPLYVAEVCAGVGVSERTLRLHCLAQLGVNPHRYLWLRRMHQVRRSLSLGDATAKTVTEIATDHGFFELGRFAVSYRTLFGEMPSATLRRPADAKLCAEV
jgi:AraC-like DNA-binding protein